MAQEQQTPGERALELIRLLLPNWQPTTGNVLRWIRIALAVGIVILGVLLILDVISSIFDIKLWNLLKVLAVPITVGAAVPWFNWAQKRRELEAEEAQRQRELEVENQGAKDSALQTYIDKIGVMVEDYRQLARQGQKAESEYQVAVKDYERSKDMPNPRPADWDEYWRNPDDAKENMEQKKDNRKTARDLLQDKRTLIRAQTLTVLERVGKERKMAIMRFLSEAGLLNKDSTLTIPLHDADFSGADLTRMNLSDNNLREVRLTRAKLASADLRGTDLSEADLSRAKLNKAVLGTARTFNVLRDGGGEPAPPHQAIVAGANLRYADLSEAVGIEERQLSAAKSLQGATMPDRSIND